MKKVIFLNLFVLLTVAVSCTAEMNINPLNEMERNRYRLWFSVNGGELLSQGYVSTVTSIGSEGGTLVFTQGNGNIAGWGLLTRGISNIPFCLIKREQYIYYARLRPWITLRQIEWERATYEKATGRQLPEDHFTNHIVITIDPEPVCKTTNPFPLVNRIKSEYFVVARVSDRKLMVEVPPNTTGKENVMVIGLFTHAGHYVWVIQSAE